MSKILLSIGIVLGVIVAMLLYFYTKEIEDEHQIDKVVFLALKADVSLSEGESVTKDKLRDISLPKENYEGISSVAIAKSEESFGWILEKKVTKDVPKGSFLQYEHFAGTVGKGFDAKIALGKRAITIPVNQTSAVGYFVEPGSNVDILGMFPGKTGIMFRSQNNKQASGKAEKSARTSVMTVLQAVKVMAVGDAITRGSYLGSAKKGYSTVTFEVSPEDAEILLFALKNSQGGLTLLLRNPGNTETIAISETPSPFDD